MDTFFLKGLGSAGSAIGGAIGRIPFVKEGPIDEWLKSRGDLLKNNAKTRESSVIRQLSSVGNPETGIFMEKLDILNRICNHTSKICFDSEQIYLMPDYMENSL